MINNDSGTDTIMDFDYPNNEPACDLILFQSYDQLSFSNLKITDVGDDIVIDIVRKKGNGKGRESIVSTIILKDALLNGVTVDESTFRYSWPDSTPPDCNPSRYWCDK